MKNKLVKLFSMMLALAMIFALAACTNTNSTTSNESTTAADAGAAQPVNDMADVPAATPEAVSGATMSLTGEYGDILLAVERAWDDARSK